MDYERESGADSGEQPTTSETMATSETPAPTETPAMSEMPAADDATVAAAEASDAESATPAVDTAAQGHEPAGASDAAESMSDLGSDADIMNDSFESHEAAPPEWPAVDLVPSMSDAPLEPADPGDDSDAPILEEATVPASAAPEAHIRADNVTLNQSGAQSIQASTVTVSQGGAGQVHADTVNIEQGGLGMARTKTLTLGQGASAFAVVADEATVEEGSNTFLVVSRTFNGDVKPTIDWRVAMAFGAGLGLTLSILRRLR